MLSDKEFIAAIQENEQIIHKVCNLYMRSKHDKQDLFQEIILNAWKGIKQFRNEAKFSTWLYRVALNTAITMLKKEQKNTAVVLLQEAGLHAEQVGEEDLQYQAMIKAVATLNDIEKALVTLYFDGYSHQEIADIIGITVNNVAVKMNRIKTRLKTGSQQFL